MQDNLSAEVKIKNLAKVYTIIEGIPIALPHDAKYVCQDKRGCWFYCARRPRIKDGDWTPNKHPIQLQTASGKFTSRVLITDPKGPWTKTLQTTIKKAQLPIQH